MNALIDLFPEAVEIDGEVYKINSDFRIGLKIILAFEDQELSKFEKRTVLMDLLYDVVPFDFEKAYELAIKFLNCGDSESSEKESEPSERLYSFDKDAKYIFSAIKQTHGVDLEAVEYLHWWKFVYMFLDLSEDCFFTKMLYYRKQRSKGKLTKEEREYCAQIKDILDLPVIKTPEELAAENEFMRLWNGGADSG